MSPTQISETESELRSHGGGSARGGGGATTDRCWVSDAGEPAAPVDEAGEAEEARREELVRWPRLKKVCKLCERQISQVDYKDEHLLSRFITDRGKILPRRATGSCARHQRQIALAIKRGRYLALLPYIRDYH